MSEPTQQAAAAAPGGQAAPAAPAEFHEPDADAFQQLWEADAFAPTDATGGELTGEQRAQLERDAQGGNAQTQQQGAGEQAGEEGQQQGADGAQQPDGQQAADQGKEYNSLEEYLAEQKLDPAEFMTLPVTTKVDGVEKPVSIADLRDAYQLKEASYNRMNALASERTAFQGEQTQVRQALGTRIQQTEALFKMAQDALTAEFNSITPEQWGQLDAGQQALVRQQYNERQQQIQRGLQQVQSAREQEAEQAKQSQLQAIPQERAKLLAARPEWKDPAKFRTALEGISKAGETLGYTQAELQGITDHRALLGLDLVAKALQLQASKPAALRRVRAAPRMAAAGTRQPSNPQSDRSRSAAQAYASSGGRNDAAGAAMFDEYW